MGVVDVYKNTEQAAGKKYSPAKVSGSEVKELVATFETVAADDDGSVYRFATLPGDAIITEMTILHDAITGATDIDIGLYAANEGAVIDKDCFTDGDDLSSAGTADGLQTVDNADRAKRVWEIAGHTASNKHANYDVAMTGNTIGSGAVTFTAILRYIQG